MYTTFIGTGSTVPVAIVTASWVVFILVWVVSAFSAKRNARYGSFGLLIRVVVIIAFIAIFQSRSAREALFQWQLVIPPTMQWLGAAFAACGVAIAIWARATLGRNWGMPMSLKQDPELVTSGPYAYVRHPIYSGMILTMLGTTLVVVWWVVPLVFFFFYFVWAAKTEERIMSSEFPEIYPDYMKRTNMLIPFVF